MQLDHTDREALEHRIRESATPLTPSAGPAESPLFLLDGTIYRAEVSAEYGRGDNIGRLYWRFVIFPLAQYRAMPDCPGRHQFEAELARIPQPIRDREGL